jgi:hypothetical protein
MPRFKSDGSSDLFLANGRLIDGVAIRSHVFDSDGDDIAASQLAVDGKIEHRQSAGSLLDLELGPDRPNVFLTERFFGLSAFEVGLMTQQALVRFHAIDHPLTLGCQRLRQLLHCNVTTTAPLCGREVDHAYRSRGPDCHQRGTCGR